MESNHGARVDDGGSDSAADPTGSKPMTRKALYGAFYGRLADALGVRLERPRDSDGGVCWLKHLSVPPWIGRPDPVAIRGEYHHLVVLDDRGDCRSPSIAPTSRRRWWHATSPPTRTR